MAGHKTSGLFFQYLEIQDTARKRRPPLKKTGAWAGGVFVVNSEGVFMTITQEKWDKVKAYIQELLIEVDKPKMSHKKLKK